MGFPVESPCLIFCHLIPVLLPTASCASSSQGLCYHPSSVFSPCDIIYIGTMTCQSCLWTGQLQWYHTRISKSKTKSSMTVWPEEKTLLQLRQVKSKLADRSGNVLPKQAGCESVLRPRSRAQGLSPAVADLAQGYRPPAGPCLIKHIYHMFVLS